MNPITEALEIVEIMMATKSTSGLGRLHRLLTSVRDKYFLAEDDSPWGCGLRMSRRRSVERRRQTTNAPDVLRGVSFLVWTGDAGTGID